MPHPDSTLPEDPAALMAVIAALRGDLVEERAARRAAELGLQAKTLEAERLRVQIARLRHERFGRSSERLAGEVEQLELRLDEVLADIAATGGTGDAKDKAASGPAPEEKTPRRGRRPLPENLPRRDVEHLPAEGCACRSCGGALRKVGEDVTEILEYRPGRFEVVRHIRPALSCRVCEAMTQAPMPSLPIERGRPGPGLLAHVLVSKYCDHLPLYRQSEIYGRDGLDLPRGLLAGWVGKSAALAEPMAAYIGRHALSGPRVHADDTPMPMLSPGRGRTQTARVWAYLRDDRPFGGLDPPAVFYEFTPDRKGEHPQRRLRDFRGILQADAYSGFNALYEGGRVVEAACWTHARRYFHDELLANDSPIAREAIERMRPLFAIEADIHGQPPEARLGTRLTRSAPLMADLHTWLEATLRRIFGKSDLAKAIRYTLAQWSALTAVLRDGRACLHNNAAERRMRPLALGRKNYLFAGSLEGGRRAAIIYTLVGTAELNGWDPQAYLRVLLDRIADHPINRIDHLAPWNLRPNTI
ncbi:IS66 family transposase [Falsiroseomonas stagni]|uniref:Transposase n=1 Tax=Falsiroseomonas stagni DSM 19981 TaxID=1123062 RepID=A0A1I4FDV1_9PROT|nr:IS66 family transposase [Falsiroseomonas stagni]SFL15699.1 Transposase [Falsiroseomonas stagni DSM 19981]